MAIFHPFLRNPVSDITGYMLNAQHTKCAEFEMRMMECFEAYGVERGGKHPHCQALAADFKECLTNDKAMRRFEAMWFERQKQYYLEGKLKDKHYAPAPKADSI
ncbi:uncharacterized protein LOC132194943 [Neocloeon triangulifer]|uniref:uncharacterized protein LOC132194943 n=1 Tax=Neocloeon triangulifer TaxID=2078957 RepID=UPI00286F034F|nr:uncharacterized protein LOC132194943 [Neocloeon triangulifer]XP_059472534.1 uncharacterized protein LOC132194943 [Neocloeon triangulifer]